MTKITTVVLILLVSSTGASQTIENIEARLEEYMAAFNDQNTDLIANTFLGHPVTVNSGQSITILNTPDESAQFMTQYFEQLNQRGWANTKVRDFDICVMSDSLVFLDNEYSRFKADGTEIEPAIRRTLQVWQKFDDSWRLVAFYFHHEDVRVGCSQ